MLLNMTTRLLSAIVLTSLFISATPVSAATIKGRAFTPRLGTNLDSAKARADIRAKQRAGTVKAYTLLSNNGARCLPMEYRKIADYGFMSGELATGWSWYSDINAEPNANVGTLGRFFSIGQDGVVNGSVKLNQVDFSMVKPVAIKNWISEMKANKEAGTWSELDIDGRKASVLTLPLVDGGKSLQATGGRTIVVTWSQIVDGTMTELGLAIHQQGRGDDAFRCGVDHFLSTIDLDAFGKAYGLLY